MNFIKFFTLIKPPIIWIDDEGFRFCKGCSRKMDKPEMEFHWPLNCSLSKLKTLHKIRQIVIEVNPKLYQKYCEARGIKNLPKIVKSKVKPRQVPLSWYKKQIENFSKLPMNIEEPSGTETEELTPILLRKLTEEDLIPKLYVKRLIKTGDPIIDSIPMRDAPFRDLDGNVIRLEDLEE